MRATHGAGPTGVLAAAVLLGLALAPGCASTRPEQVVYAPDELRRELRERLGPQRAEHVIIPFEISRSLRQLALDETLGQTRPWDRLDQLSLILTDPTELGLQYDRDRTYSAEGAFAERRGDCLSLTNLYVGLARSLDLDVYYVEALQKGDYGTEGELTVEYRHICAGYGIGTETMIYDFDRVGPGISRYRVLTDLEAMARFYNTLGYQELRKETLLAATEHFETAVLLDPEFPWAANNLGVAYERQGRLVPAANLFRRAIELDPGYAAPYGNLARVLRAQGDEKGAAKMIVKRAELRTRDPVPDYRRGLEQLPTDPRKAIESFRRALDLDREFVQARLGLARAYLALGDYDAAERQVRRALQQSPHNKEAEELLATIRK